MTNFTNQNNNSSDSQAPSTSTLPSSSEIGQRYNGYLATLPDPMDDQFQGLSGVGTAQANLASIGATLQPSSQDAPTTLDEDGNLVSVKGPVANVTTKQPIQAPQKQVLAGVDLSHYATNPTAFATTSEIYNKASSLIKTPKDMDAYIKQYAPKSQVKAAYVYQAAQQAGVDPLLVLAKLQDESMFGTKETPGSRNNPMNIGNNDRGNKVNFKNIQQGIQKGAQFLAQYKVSS